MKTKILVLLFATSFLFVNCTSENEQPDENFSLKKIREEIKATSRMTGEFTTLDVNSPNWDCSGAPTDCAPVIVINPKDEGLNRMFNNDYSDYIDPSIVEAKKKGLVTEEVRFNENQNTDYVLFTDNQGDKMVYRFKQE